MRRTRVSRHSSRAQPPDSHPEDAATVAATIDALYGLEPVFEPGTARSSNHERGGSCFQLIHCPYCGEPFETLVDVSAGSADYVEDCQVCCRPIQFQLEVDHEGRLIRLTAGRGD